MFAILSKIPHEQIDFRPSESGEEATFLDHYRWRCLQQSELPAILLECAQRLQQKIGFSSPSSRPNRPTQDKGNLGKLVQR